ncbi:MAG: endonuclease/exonuclease/phosphatase family protein [Legionellaceae bacterium]|nr:endonuclease/exonuclease/phosphatase family protein [Legionellaceae bacterium]
MVNMKISLVTYNIHKGYSLGRIRFLLPQMREALHSLTPDFVFLQEVQGEHRRRQKRIEAWPEISQSEYMAQDSWPHYVYAKNAIYQSGHHGNAILSKYAFEQFKNINLSNMNRASRSILHTKVRLVGEQETVLHLLCVHLGLFKGERAEQAQALMQRIEESVPAHEPLIMAGDFNDWRNHLSEPLLDRLAIQEAFHILEGEPARSFPAMRPALSIDRIYFRGMKVEEVCCLGDKPWRNLSDHLPLFASFSLAE